MSGAVKISNYQRPVNLLEITQRGKAANKTSKPEKDTFKEMFSRELAEDRSVMFSQHASKRLFSRNIELSSEQLGKIADGIDRAAAKGSRETLVLMDDVALVVAVKNRTVVTAFDRDNLRDGVVTSIDSAVII